MGKYLDIVRQFELQQPGADSATAPSDAARQEACHTDTPESASSSVSGGIYEELVAATPPSKALEVFPDWAALLVQSQVLGLSVWVVRDEVHGIALAKETGQPALMLDAVLAQQGRTREEARAALLPLLITVEQ